MPSSVALGFVGVLTPSAIEVFVAFDPSRSTTEFASMRAAHIVAFHIFGCGADDSSSSSNCCLEEEDDCTASNMMNRGV